MSEDINLKYVEYIESKFGYFWDYKSIFVLGQSMQEYKSKITDPEELYYFELFENSMIGKFINKLTEEEKSALMNYTARIGSTFKDINDGLRNNYFSKPIYYQEQINHLDSAVSKFQLEEDITLYRAVKLDTFKQYGINNLDEITTLENFTDKGFMSCSLFKENSYAYFKEYPILLEIQVPKNTPGMYVEFTKAYANYDFEFVLGRNTSIDITGFHKEVINGEEKLVIEGNVVKNYIDEKEELESKSI